MNYLELKGTLFWTFLLLKEEAVISAYITKLDVVKARLESLNPDDIKDISNSHPLERFMGGLKTDKTTRSYTVSLKSVLCTALKNVLHGTYEERAVEIVKMAKEDPDRVCNTITMLVRMWIEQTKLERSDPKYMAPGSIRTSLTPVQKLLNMNAAPLAWKVIFGTCPGTDHGGSKPGWVREDIRKMLLKNTSALTRAAILIMTSSGVRSGGLELKWDDIDPVYLKDGEPVAGEDAPEMYGTADPACAMMRVYRDDPEAYTTFMTPEAYKALMEYKVEWEEEVGRAPEPKDPVFKKRGCKSIPLKSEMVIKRVRMIAKKAGVQTRSKENGKLYRVPLANGFRRGFNKILTDAPTDGNLGNFRKKEHMLGHLGTMGLDRIYYDAPPMELAAQYLLSVPALTVTDEGLLLIERKEMNETILKVQKELKRMKRKDEARTGMTVRQDADRTATQIDEKVDNLTKVVENVLKRLDSQDKGQ